MNIRPTVRVLTICLAAACSLASCSRYGNTESGSPGRGANEAPPAAPIGINIQNQNDGNNFARYRESITVHNEGSVTGLTQPGLSQQMADVLVTMEGIHTAHVLVSGDQAFVAVTLRNADGSELRQTAEEGESVSRYMKGSISDKIRTMDPSIRHVYVTDRTQYMQQFETLRTGIREGRPVEGILRELSESVTRIIPDWSIGNLTPPAVTP